MKCKDCANYECPNRGDGERECVYINGPYRFFGTPTMPFFDWQSFRAEAAKDILSKLITIGTYDSQNFGSISKPDYRKIFIPCYTKECAVTKAIEIADELCKQLKEKEK